MESISKMGNSFCRRVGMKERKKVRKQRGKARKRKRQAFGKARQ